MPNIIIDNEFKALLPALDADTYALLEENLIQNGCRDSLVLWGDILIDGHNRYEICTKHDIPYNTINKEFASREEALIWIISTQVSRRNLKPIQLSYYRGLHYQADKIIQGTKNQYVIKSDNEAENVTKSEKGQNDTFHFSTKNRLAGQYNVSPKTITRDAKLAKAIDAIGESSPEAKRKIFSGEIAIPKKTLEDISHLPYIDVAALSASIEDGTYEKKKPAVGNEFVGKTGNVTGGVDIDASGSKDRADNGVSSGPEEIAGDQLIAGMHELDVALRRITDAVYSEIRAHAENNDITGVKASFRRYIEMLEELYKKIL